MSKKAEQFFLRHQLDELLQSLSEEGYNIVGPKVEHHAIVYKKITRSEQLPQGIENQQSPGEYTLTKTESQRYFSWANGPQAIKPYTFKAEEKLWSVSKNNSGSLNFQNEVPKSEKIAFIGVRACDLAALHIHDLHFLKSDYLDSYYQERRKNLLLVAVNCSHPADTCFCVSTGDGPSATQGYDLVLTELDSGYLIKSGSDQGETILSTLKLSNATSEQLNQAQMEHQNAINVQKKGLPKANIAAVLENAVSHPHWEDIANRCLACGNCTAVCPTCFCHSEHDEAALDGSSSTHIRQWDSCFNQDHSYIHGIVIRAENKNRYRQWLTHKFSSWIKQYDLSGCVGCGRCISWCPVGIDVRDELEVFSESS